MKKNLLENWYEVKVGDKSVLFGDLYNDEKKRWPDGSPIRTSLVSGPFKEGSEAQTMNTTYNLGKQSKLNR